MGPRHLFPAHTAGPLAAALLALPQLWACGDVQAQRRARVVGAPAGPIVTGAAAASPSATPRLHALLVNGGGTPEDNFKSHLLHLREMQALLGEAGVTGERLTVLASDGEDPRPDLAVRGP